MLHVQLIFCPPYLYLDTSGNQIRVLSLHLL